jgi:hypothetical protein
MEIHITAQATKPWVEIGFYKKKVNILVACG